MPATVRTSLSRSGMGSASGGLWLLLAIGRNGVARLALLLARPRADLTLGDQSRRDGRYRIIGPTFSHRDVDKTIGRPGYRRRCATAVPLAKKWTRRHRKTFCNDLAAHHRSTLCHT